MSWSTCNPNTQRAEVDLQNRQTGLAYAMGSRFKGETLPQCVCRRAAQEDSSNLWPAHACMCPFPMCPHPHTRIHTHHTYSLTIVPQRVWLSEMCRAKNKQGFGDSRHSSQPCISSAFVYLTMSELASLLLTAGY